MDCPKVHREYDPSAKDIQGDVNYQSFARIVQSHHAQIQSVRELLPLREELEICLRSVERNGESR